MAKVYVSSTYDDLKEVREQVRLTLRRLHHEDVAMEYYVAEDRRPLDRCFEDVASCDVYVGLFAWRYGYVPPNSDRSITEIEYDHARAEGKKCLCFLLDKKAPWPFERVEDDALPRIKALRAKLEGEHLAGYFTSKDDVGGRLAEAISAWEKSISAESTGRLDDWLAGCAAQLERALAALLHLDEADLGESTRRYIETLVRKRPENQPEKEAFPLTGVAAQPGARVMVLGGGGAGKSTMLLKLASDCARRAVAAGDGPTPIHARLNFFDAPTRAFDGLLDLIARDAGLAVDELRELWERGKRRCLFLLDGLNEVRPEFQAGCRLALQQLVQRAPHGYVITSRPGPAADELARQLGNECLVTEVVRIEPGQIREFLAAYGVADLYDRMGERLRALAQSPFLLWAIAQSCAALPQGRLPENVGQLYENLIDRYVFAEREQTKPRESRPTRYSYELVKKPVLARLALNMSRRRVTRESETTPLLIGVRDQLLDIRETNEGVRPVEPHALMPDRPVASALLDEIVENGVLQRTGDTIEFMHESVRDYFAAVAMATWRVEDVVDEVPRLVWRRVVMHDSDDERLLYDPLHQASVLLSGLLPDSSELVTRLVDRHPLLAAHCLAGAEVLQPAARASALERLSALLSRRHPRYRWIGCECLRVMRTGPPEVARLLGEIVRHDYSVRDAAARALASLNDADVIGALVDDALDDSVSENNLPDRVAAALAHLPSATAVERILTVWRDPAEPEGRRHRAEGLLATMSPQVVGRVLGALAEEAAGRGEVAYSEAARAALAGLPTWKPIGLPMRSHEESVAAFERRIAPLREQMAALAPEELIGALAAEDPNKRVVAARLLAMRGTDRVADLLERLGREQDPGVRSAISDAVAAVAPPEELLVHWRSLMLDDGWTRVFTVDRSLAEDLRPGGDLTERWRAEFKARGLWLGEPALVANTSAAWLIAAKRWSGPHSDVPSAILGPYSEYSPYSVHHYVAKAGVAGLDVFDGGARPRLAAVAEVIGKPAIPVLEAALAEQDRLLDRALFAALRSIGGAEAVSVLAPIVLRADTSDFDDIVGPALDALAGTRSPDAVPPLLEGLRALRPPSVESGGDDSRGGYGGGFPSEFESRIRQVANALGELGAGEQLVDWARDALSGGGVEARLAATIALAAAHDADPGIESLLTAASADPSRHVRRQAWRGLTAGRTKSAEDALIRVCLDEPDPGIRREAASELRWLPGDGGVHRLVEALGSGTLEQRTRAAWALVELEDESAIDPLLAALESGPGTLRVAAIAALDASGYEQVERLVVAALSLAREDPDPVVCEAASHMAWRLLFVGPADGDGAGLDVLYKLIQDAITEGRYADAIGLVGGETPVVPDDPNLYRLRAYARTELNELPAAAQDLERAAELAPDAAEIHADRARVLAALYQWQAAATAARRSVELEGDNASYQELLAGCAYEAGDLSESIDASRRALRLEPGRPAASLNLGLALLAEGRQTEALEAYRNAVETLRELADGPVGEMVATALGDVRALTAAHEQRAALAAPVTSLLEAALRDR